MAEPWVDTSDLLLVGCSETEMAQKMGMLVAVKTVDK
jgi:hypothetical protein